MTFTLTIGNIYYCGLLGLDPSDGAWDYNDTDTRLDSSDGEFVDVIHTNGGEFSNGEVAFYEPMGHVDFYVNGGHKQPGCPEQPDLSKEMFNFFRCISKSF